MKTSQTVTCEACGKLYTPTYKVSSRHKFRFCSKSCAVRQYRCVYHSAHQLETAAVAAIKSAGRYLSSGELYSAMKCSSKTFTGYNVSTLMCNKKAGVKRPTRMFEQLVYQALKQKFDVETEVVLDGCVSPKGYPLRFDFKLTNTNVLVEADGCQHEPNPTNPWASDYRLECDRIKDDFANANGYTLVRIPYSKQVTVDYVVYCVMRALNATTQSETINVNAEKIEGAGNQQPSALTGEGSTTISQESRFQAESKCPTTARVA